GIAPAFHILIDRLAFRLLGGVGGQVVDLAAAQPVTSADLQRLEPVEHVELGQSDAGDSADRAALPDEHRVEPAATALTRGDRAEFVATLAEPLADLVLEFGRERARADARGVSLDDAEHETRGIGPEAAATGDSAADGV